MYPTTWMDLENIMLSKISYTQKGGKSVVPLILGMENRHVHKDSRIEVTEDFREGRRKCEWLQFILRITKKIFAYRSCLGLYTECM